MRNDTPKTARELGIMQGFPPPPGARPGPTNWDLAPFNRWSFLNIRSLLPTVEVWRGDGPVSPLPVALQDIGTVPFVTSKDKPSNFAAMLDATYTDGCMVLWRGQVIFEQYFNDMQPHTLHLSQSVAKSLVGALAGVLHGQGLLDLDAPLGSLIPELASTGYATATAAHVLDMQSGVRFDETYTSPTSDVARIDIACGWRPTPPGQARPTLRDIILTLPQERPHGEVFNYRSIETDVLAWVLERVAQAPLAQLLSTHVWQPMGAERDGCFTVDQAGTALADGGFNATLRDYARFGELIRNQGRQGDRQIIPADWITGTGQGDNSRFGHPYTVLSPNGAYRRQFWIQNVDRGDLMARGVFGQLIYIDPIAELTVVKLSTWPDYLMPRYIADTVRAIHAVRDWFAR